METALLKLPRHEHPRHPDGLLTLCQGWGVLLEQGEGDPRAAAFAAVPREVIEAAMARVDALARPPDDPYFDELLVQHSRVRRFLPGLARVAQLGAAPAAKPLLAALHQLRKGDGTAARLPVEFVPPGWLARVVRDGAVDPKAWTLCVVDRMRAALRRRDLFASPSLRYADPRAGLLDGAAWESARPAVCRSLGVSASGPEEVARMVGRLDAAYRATAARLPGNASVRIETAADGTAALSLSALDKLDEPASLVALRAAAAARMPRVDLPEILLEMHARTGFAARFTHASERGARAGDLGHQHLCRAAGGSLQHRAGAADPAGHAGAAPVAPELGAAELHPGRHARPFQRHLGRGPGCHPARPRMGRRRRGIRRRAALRRARADDPFRAEPALLRAGAPRHTNCLIC